MGFSLGRIFRAVATGGLSEVVGGGDSGSGGGSSSNSTNDAQIGASESGLANQSGTAGKDNSTVLGANSSLIAGGVSLTGPNTGSITIEGASGVEGVTKAFTDTLSQINDTAATSSKSAFEKLTTLAETKQTEGLSSLGKIALGIVALIALAYVASRWKK